MISPDGSLADFPRLFWPRIRTQHELDSVIAAVVQRAVVRVLPLEQAKEVAGAIVAGTTRVVAAGLRSPTPTDPESVMKAVWEFDKDQLLVNWKGAWRSIDYPIEWPPGPDPVGAGPDPWPLLGAGLAEAALTVAEGIRLIDVVGSEQLRSEVGVILQTAMEALSAG